MRSYSRITGQTSDDSVTAISGAASAMISRTRRSLVGFDVAVQQRDHDGIGTIGPGLRDHLAHALRIDRRLDAAVLQGSLVSAHIPVRAGTSGAGRSENML